MFFNRQFWWDINNSLPMMPGKQKVFQEQSSIIIKVVLELKIKKMYFFYCFCATMPPNCTEENMENPTSRHFVKSTYNNNHISMYVTMQHLLMRNVWSWKWLIFSEQSKTWLRWKGQELILRIKLIQSSQWKNVFYCFAQCRENYVGETFV